MPVHTAILGAYWKLLESHDIEPGSVIPSSVYRPDRYIGLGAYVHFGEISRMADEIFDLIADETAGLQVAKLLYPSHLGMFGHAWIAAPSLAANIRMLQRFSKTFASNIRVVAIEGKDTTEVIYETLIPLRNNSMQKDSLIASFVWFARLHAGSDFQPLAVRRSCAEPGTRKPWDDFFGVPVEFNAGTDSVVVDAKLAARPLSTSHGGLFDKHLEALAATTEALEESDTVGNVRREIRRSLPSGRTSESVIAVQMGLNPRTMHRRLAEQGTSFGSQVLDIRKLAAKQMLLDGGRTITEIGFLLGYSSTSGFSRAFKSWFGVSPSQYRRTGEHA